MRVAVSLLLFTVGCSYDWTVGDGPAPDAGIVTPPPVDAGKPDAAVPKDAGVTPRTGECGERCECKNGDTCRFTCPKGKCELGCSNRSNCALDCAPGASCNIACTDESTCAMDCAPASTCGFTCREKATCSGDCTGAVCTRNCPTKCDVKCAGALCL